MVPGMDGSGRVELPQDVERRLTTYRAAGAVPLIGVWGWFAVLHGDQTPIFVYLNIAVHEVGHVLFRPFGELTMLIMGSGFEVLFPLLMAGYFVALRKDTVAGAVCLGWGASALASAATYIADADDGALLLLGATGPDAAGDWERILGVEFFDKVYLADRIAGFVRAAGVVVWIVALAIAAGTIVWQVRAARPTSTPAPRSTASPAGPFRPVTDEEMWG
jgi:hypothetical protein